MYREGMDVEVGVLSSGENKINTLIYRRNPTAILPPPQARRVSHFRLKKKGERETQVTGDEAQAGTSRKFTSRERRLRTRQNRESLTCNLSLFLYPIPEAGLFTRSL